MDNRPKTTSVQGPSAQSTASPANAPGRFPPQGYAVFFKQAAEAMRPQLATLQPPASFRFRGGHNWFEVAFARINGYYCLRLARNFDEFAFYMMNSSRFTAPAIQAMEADLEDWSGRLGYRIRAQLEYTLTWARLGFDLPPEDAAALRSGEDAAASYAETFAKFIQATQPRLQAIFAELQGGQRRTPPQAPRAVRETPFGRPGDASGLGAQAAILEHKVAEIRRVLSGGAPAPADEQLCDWVHFCYDFGLYAEGRTLFALVDPAQVHPWYYARAQRIARVCASRSKNR